MITIIAYKAKDGHRWRMKRKGRIIAESGEAYRRKFDLEKALTSIENAFKLGEVERKDEDPNQVPNE